MTIQDNRFRTNQLTNPTKIPLKKLVQVTSIACGIQFGWALQFSLLTPYIQELGISHTWSSIVWLCGPLSGILVQPLVGHASDKCTSRFGRRRPFIVAGASLTVVAVLIIGHAADIGGLLGDGESYKPRSMVVFIIGFWIFDVANNMTQGPCRALLADLTGNDHRRNRIANSYFSLFLAIGSVLGYATGSYGDWFTVFPFTVTSYCGVNCANLKSAFFLDIGFIVLTTCLTTLAAQESPLGSTNKFDELDKPQVAQEAFLWELFGSFKYLSTPIWIIFLVTALTWLGWSPFILYDTDWMGREIYKGEPNIGSNYQSGVRVGAFGLMLNSIVVGVTSAVMEKLCKKWGGDRVLGFSNFLMSVCFVAMLILSLIVKNMEFPSNNVPPNIVISSALCIFAVLGIPLAVAYCVPYAMISSRIEVLGLGQGLSMGVLNLSIVLPQMMVSLGSGPWDQLFGGGNSPALVVAVFAALASGMVSILVLPRYFEKSRTCP